MKKFTKKSMAITIATLMMLGGMPRTEHVFGEVFYDEGLPSPSLYKSNSYDIRSAEDVIKDTYWANLKKGYAYGIRRNLSAFPDYLGIKNKNLSETERTDLFEVTAKDYDRYFSEGVFPEYVLTPSETALEELPLDYGIFKNIRNLLSSGITETELGIMDSSTVGLPDPEKINSNYEYEKPSISALGYLLGNDVNLNDSPYFGRDPKEPIGNVNNPYKFKEENLLSQDEINDPKKLTVFGDIKKTGDSDSSSIGFFEQGKEANLSFTINADWIRRLVMGYTLNKTRYYTEERITKGIYEKMDGMVDSQIVYTIDIPNELEVKNPSAKISGLKGFNVSTEVEEESGIKRLIVTLRVDESIQGKKIQWSDFIEKLKNMDNRNVNIDISGVYIKSTVAPDTKVTLKGTVGGFIDWATRGLDQPGYIEANRPNDFDKNLPEPDDTEDDSEVHPDFIGRYKAYNRVYLYFVGKQSDTGRDQAAPGDKPNLISYTFKVKKKEDKPAVSTQNTSKGPKKSDNANTGRIDGKDRIETAINISKKNYDRAKSVIVVRHDLFPDSMTASVLAKLKDAPILLNPTDKLDSRVGDEIKRLGAEEVIIVGGQNSVSERVREDLKVYDVDKNVERIAGTDRYGTSEMVAKRVVGITGKKNTGVVASGQVFPDALSVGTFASREGYPILLVKKDSVPSQVQNAIKDLDINKTYIAGGTNTISKSTEANIPNVVERMAGSTRYETSVAIAKSKFGASKEAYIASGEEFADALVISPVSGKYNRPTLLVSTKAANNGPVRNYVKDSKISKLTAIGGQRYVPSSIIDGLVK